MLDGLKNVCIKIPLLQSINEILIFAKTIKKLCIRKPGRKRKDVKKIQLVGKIANIMMGKPIVQKYLDPSGFIVKIYMNGIEIPNTLIDLEASINIMSKKTMDKLKLLNLQYTLTLLQLVGRSVIKPNGILEDVSVS